MMFLMLVVMSVAIAVMLYKGFGVGRTDYRIGDRVSIRDCGDSGDSEWFYMGDKEYIAKHGIEGTVISDLVPGDEPYYIVAFGYVRNQEMSICVSQDEIKRSYGFRPYRFWKYDIKE